MKRLNLSKMALLCYFFYTDNNDFLNEIDSIFDVVVEKTNNFLKIISYYFNLYDEMLKKIRNEPKLFIDYWDSVYEYVVNKLKDLI